jgi:hypothetical protein
MGYRGILEVQWSKQNLYSTSIANGKERSLFVHEEKRRRKATCEEGSRKLRTGRSFRLKKLSPAAYAKKETLANLEKLEDEFH